MKQKAKISGPWMMSILVALLGGWHFLETKRGAAATGDFWLCNIYVGLFAASVVFLAVFGLVFLMPGMDQRHGKLLSAWSTLDCETDHPSEISYVFAQGGGDLRKQERGSQGSSSNQAGGQ